MSYTIYNGKKNHNFLSYRVIETNLGELKKGDKFIYFGSKTMTKYNVISNDGNTIKYFIGNSTLKSDNERIYSIELDKPYNSYGIRFYRRVLKII